MSDKTGILDLAKCLIEFGFKLIASGGTASFIKNDAKLPVICIEEFTGSQEILGGRVKTLHPAIHGGKYYYIINCIYYFIYYICTSKISNNIFVLGILARLTPADQNDLQKNNYSMIKIVVCNLYPFENVVEKPETTISEAVENIDIGGITLLRAAAKNYERVTVLCDQSDYSKVMEEITLNKDTSLETRKKLSLKAFTHSATYGNCISDYFRKKFSDGESQMNLRYGMNPHQTPAQLYTTDSQLPLKGNTFYV